MVRDSLPQTKRRMELHSRVDHAEIHRVWSSGVPRNEFFVQRIAEKQGRASLDTLQHGTSNGRAVVSHNDFRQSAQYSRSSGALVNNQVLPAAEFHFEHEAATEVSPELVSLLTKHKTLDTSAQGDLAQKRDEHFIEHSEKKSKTFKSV